MATVRVAVQIAAVPATAASLAVSATTHTAHSDSCYSTAPRSKTVACLQKAGKVYKKTGGGGMRMRVHA